jgi:hypothetical protein
LASYASGLEQEPAASLGLVQPVLDQAGGDDIVIFLAQGVEFAQARGQIAIVVAQFGQHVLRVDEGRVIVQHALVAGDMADRADRRSAQLARAFGHRIGHGEDLLGLTVQQQVIVLEMRARDVPVEVLGLQIKREDIGQQCGERRGQIARGILAKARWRGQRGKALGLWGDRHEAVLLL